MNAVRVNLESRSIDIDVSDVEYYYEKGKGWVASVKGDDLLWAYMDPVKYTYTMPVELTYDTITRRYVLNNIINTVDIRFTIA